MTGASVRTRSRRACTVALGVGLLIGSCSSSDGASSDSVPADVTVADDEDDVFSQNAADSVDEDPVESAVDGSQPDDSVPASAVATPVDTADGSEPVDTASEEGDNGGTAETAAPIEVVDDVDNLDELDDLIDFGEVDDVPFCQAYARVFEAFLAVSFGAAFGQVTSSDPDAVVVSAETYEVILYPGLLDAVDVIRSEDFDEVDDLLAPIFERIELAPQLLSEAGLSDGEIAELTGSARANDLDSIDLDGVDPRVVAAAIALVAESGSFEDAVTSMVDPVDADGSAEERFVERCPQLASAFDNL